MKKHIFLISCFGFLLFSGQSFAQQTRFDRGSSLLEEGRYQESIDVYRSIAESGYQSGALWLNLGVAYARIDSLGMAKYYFLRAEKYQETEERAANALAYVNNRFPRQSAVLPTLPWIRFINFLSDSFGLRAIALTALVLLYAGVAMKIGSWFRVDLKKVLSYSGYAAIGLSALLFICSVIINYQENRYATGVMIHREGTVYEQPNEDASIVSTAYEGYTMQVDKTESEGRGEWKYIRLENGMYGWIEEDQIRFF